MDMSINANHNYTDEKGCRWSRIWNLPQINSTSASNIDPFNKKQWTERTREKKGTLGNLFDESKEMSLKRTDKEGFDVHREKYYADYSKKRRGKKLQIQQQEEFMKNPPKGFDIEL